MANTIDILDCDGGNIATFFDGCQVKMSDITKVLFKNPATLINDPIEDFDPAAISMLIKQGKLVAMNDMKTFAGVAAANNYQTLANKIELYISQGLYKFNLMFEADACLVKALHKLSKKKWEVLLGDSSGKLWFDGQGGRLNGFQASIVVPENETVNDGGGALAMVTLVVQLTPRGTAGYNTRRSFLLGQDWDLIQGIQDTILTAESLDVSAGVGIMVVGGCDGTEPVLGLGTDNFVLVDAATNVVITGTTVTEVGGGLYTMMGATAGARIIKLGDAANNLNVADVLDQAWFQSNQLAVTLVA